MHHVRVQVMSVVIVNTLLTSVMGKLAKFERHVSLSDYTSTVTAKLALAQFLNTALIVIIVNAGYTGGGLGLLQVGVMDPVLPATQLPFPIRDTVGQNVFTRLCLVGSFERMVLVFGLIGGIYSPIGVLWWLW